jgi:hypothetical protein
MFNRIIHGSSQHSLLMTDKKKFEVLKVLVVYDLFNL